MKTIRTLISTFLIALTLMTAYAADGDMTFSFDNGSSTPIHWGTKKRERYDVAIVLEKSILNGTILKGVEIPLDGADKMTDVKVWISSGLKDNGSSDDLYSAPVDMEKDYDAASATLSHTFPQPVRIGDTDRIYVGYSFSLTALSAGAKEPLAVVPGGKGETFVKTASMSTLGKWTDLGLAKGVTSCIRALVGNARNNAASLAPIPVLHIRNGIENPVKATVINHGAAGLSSFRYEGRIGNVPFSGQASLDSPLPNLYGAFRQVEILLPAIDENGRHTLELTLTEANGKTNEEPATVTAEANVYSILPVKRPLMEEYTASSCGYCPKGMAAMEIMKNRNGDDFVALSFHTAGDPLDLFPELPISTGASIALPTSQIDRIMTIDPYLGNNTDSFGLDICWDNRAAQFTTAAISLSGTTDGHEASLTAEVEFVNPIDADTYRVEFFVAADGLTNPRWGQKNYFSKNESARDMPGLGKYVDSPGTIKGIVYDDVVVAWSGKDGGASLPAAPAYERLRATQTLAIPEIAHDGRLRGVAAVVDCATGEVLNSIQYRFGDAGVNAAESLCQPIETSYWSLQGMRMAEPKGICIRKDRLSDGSCRTTKTVVSQ